MMKGTDNIDHFVQGVLIVEDEMHILEPDLRLDNGMKIHILHSDLRIDDELIDDDPLGLLLEGNQWYEMLLLLQLGLGREKKVTYLSHPPLHSKLALTSTEFQMYGELRRRNDVLQGIILDLDWDATSQQYLVDSGSVMHTRRFVLVETAIGKMVLHYKALQERLGEQVEQLAVGGYLEWEWSRLDLLAIIEKRDPRPGE